MESLPFYMDSTWNRWGSVKFSNNAEISRGGGENQQDRWKEKRGDEPKGGTSHSGKRKGDNAR